MYDTYARNVGIIHIKLKYQQNMCMLQKCKFYMFRL